MRAAPQPAKAFFVTTQPTNEITKVARKATVAARGIKLEILDLNELAEELRTDELHRVAEYELGVRPRTRRLLRTRNKITKIRANGLSA